MPPNNTQTRFALLSLVTAFVTIALKMGAYWFTGSVGLLSDALESFVNLATAAGTLITLFIAHQPPDAEHTFGHTKAEYFSSGSTGLLILGAAGAILYSAVDRLLSPQPISQLGIGIGISLIAAVLNLIVARLLIQAGREHASVSLTAEGHHLMSDVWTSVGVAAGVGLVLLTGQQWLDSVTAFVVAVQLAWTGGRLLREATQGLMDTALPEDELDRLKEILAQQKARGIQYHALRTRQAGAQKFVSVHLQVPGEWTVQRSHTIAHQIEDQMRTAVPFLSTFTHIEPIEDPRSWEDIDL